MLISALLLALPVGAEACSAPGSLDETDQPHALIGTDDDVVLAASSVAAPTEFMGLVELPIFCPCPCQPDCQTGMSPAWM